MHASFAAPRGGPQRPSGGRAGAEIRYAIWGSSGHAKVLASLVHAIGGRIVATFDNDPAAQPLPGVPLYIGEAGFDEWALAAPAHAEVRGLVAIGGDRGADRLAIQEMFASRGLVLEALVHPDASVCASARLGPGTQVLARAVVAADSVVGAACIVNHAATIDHECIVADGVHVAPGATVCGCVTIGARAMIGAGAVVLPRLTIGADALVGAGAVVTRDVAAGTVVCGNPARLVTKE